MCRCGYPANNAKLLVIYTDTKYMYMAVLSPEQKGSSTSRHGSDVLGLGLGR